MEGKQDISRKIVPVHVAKMFIHLNYKDYDINQNIDIIFAYAPPRESGKTIFGLQ